jgi:chemotaxis response regulator CheB
MRATVMIVDDAVFMRSTLPAIAKEKGCRVIAGADSGIEAMRTLQKPFTPAKVISSLESLEE